MNRSLFAALSCLALAACSTAGDDKPAWKDFAQASVDRYFALNPNDAVYQGAHQFDGKLPDWSAAGLKANAEFLHQLIDDANAYDGLSEADAFERDYLVKVAEGKLFWLEVADQPHHNPAFYIGALDPNVYISREYADKPTRMKAMIAFFEKVPQAAANIRANLLAPLPESFIDYGTSAYDGFADFYRGDAREAFADVDDPELQARYEEVSGKAADAMAELSGWLKDQKASATQDFALGPERFSRMLKATEAVDIPLDELTRVARADLERNQAAARNACAEFAPGATIEACFLKMNANKPAEGPVAAATAQIPDLTAFVREKDLVSIPGTEQALVRESPPYNAQNSAYIDPPGPLEHGIPSIYYIAPPDPSWTPAMQAAYIPGKDDLLFTSVHEVMPGHFLQFLHSNRSSSLIGRLFVGYGFAEGWAHYAEEMMWDAGLGAGDPEVHIGQLSNALLRNCRFISAIGLHTGGMTLAQSKDLFMKECHQDEGNAEQQAARGTYDPAYLNYTLGKLMIRKLREDWTATRGGRPAWREFHDRFLTYGGPPIPMVRQQMMGSAAGALF
jgi:uncharacterized protein (DUF885 family)